MLAGETELELALAPGDADVLPGVGLGDCVGAWHVSVYAFPWKDTELTVVFTVPGGFAV